MRYLKNQSKISSSIVHLCLLFFLASSLSARTQDHINVDSLRIAYDYSEDPYERIQLQIKIGDAYYKKRSIDTAIFEYRKAISIIPNDSFNLKASTMERLSDSYRKIEDMPNKLLTHKSALNLYEKANNKERIARMMSQIGRDYYDAAIYDTAMTYYMNAKEVHESNQIYNVEYGYLMHFIGSVFKRQGDYDMACEYYNQEIDYGRKHGFRNVEVEGMYLYGLCIDTPEGRLVNDLKCLAIYKEIENRRGEGLMYSYLAEDYFAMDNFDSTIYFYDLCIETYKETGEISLMGAVLSDYALSLIDMGRFNEAERKLEEAEELAAITGIKQHIRYWTLYETYFFLRYEQGRYKEAVDYQSLMFAYRDSSRDQKHQDAIFEMEKIYNDEKTKSELAMSEKEVMLQQVESEKLREEKESETFIKYISFSALGLVLILGVFVYLKYRESQKQKIMISAQKREMEFQKELVEEKNRDIMDSITYASSIQKAIITSEQYISEMFKDSFIFYKPRDIVSGDFYWAFTSDDGKKLLAVGDCTGHGVPGAMMSMLGTAFLNEIVIEGGIHDPATVLNKLRDQVKRALQNESSRDGMDMSIICITDNQLTFSGANLPMYLLRQGILEEFKGNKQPVGYVPTEERPFTNHVLEIKTDDQIYLFSDGYADQFGGDKGKKYKYKTFRERLKTLSGMALNKQRTIIIDEFETWKGDLEQLDDVCVVGVKV